jgi:hypothetical protein
MITQFRFGAPLIEQIGSLLRRFGLRTIILGLGVPLLSGCVADGGNLAITSTGPAITDATAGPAKAFLDAEYVARTTDTPDNAKSMYERGYALIYFNCNQYFDSAGKTQSILVATRDAVGALGSVSTSILVLTKAPKSALAAIGIGTGAAYSGIDTYTKDFLFSAENVDAVRTLVTGALDTHRKAVLASFGDAQSQFDYNAALVQLRDEQTICTLRHVAALATEAIRNGHLVASTNTLDNDIAGLAKIQDEAVLSALGTILQTPGPVAPSEAGALWELVVDGTRDPARLKTLETMLANIPGATSPFDPASPGAGTLRASWSQSASVARTMQGFSDATKAAFEATVIASKSQQTKAQTAANAAMFAKGPAPAVAVPAPLFRLGSSPSAVATGRIDVLVH